jgi:hypothetical protein
VRSNICAAQNVLKSNRRDNPESGMSVDANMSQEPVGYHYAKRIFLIFAGLALLSVVIALSERVVGGHIALGGHSNRLTTHEIVIDNDVISVPENMIRLPEQRRDGIAERLDLYFSWPGLAGYSEEERDVFNGSAKNASIIFLSFEERAMSRDMSGRFEPIYKFLIEGNGAKGPAGLLRYVLPAKAGYLNEVLYVGPAEGGARFVVRCSEEGKEDLVAACERDIQVGTNLSATLRFPKDMLSQWRTLESVSRPFIAAMLKTTVNG